MTRPKSSKNKPKIKFSIAVKYRNAFHYVAGGVAGWILTLNPIAGLGLMFSFMIYEICQDWRKQDWSFRDILEFIIAFFVVATIATIIHIGGWF